MPGPSTCTSKEDEDFGCLMMIRMETNGTDVIRRLTDDLILSECGGTLQTMTAEIKHIEGNKWEDSKAICMLHFTNRYSANSWYQKVNDDLHDTDVIVIDIIASLPTDKRAFALALVQLSDEHQFFNDYCPKFGEPFLQAGGAVGATGRHVTRHWTSLQGCWISEGTLILINFLPDVKRALNFFFSDIYKRAQEMRQSYSVVDLVYI